tara:strand:- start:4151 stop:6160 length:2010 start_codon:yes stop_codon:yes gene_type:complete
VLKNFWLINCLLLFNSLQANYTYEANQPLFDLHRNANNFQGELAYEVVDDGISPAIDLSFNFTFYGSTFSQARMATNGCLHFGDSGDYCNDFTPDPINGQHTYTLYPFWTDLIRDNDARMKSWGDSSKMIFGWYEMREYNRASDNSFEIILWNNNSFDFRYRELDIINHDVLIGEVGSNKDNSYTYLYHDECNTGTTNSSSCVNQNWNATSFNTLLENGGSLYGSGSGNGVDCSDPLNDSSCPGYAAAYLTQQCDLDSLYDVACPLYWEAYDDQQCDEDPQYAPFCPGYQQEQSIAYYVEQEFDYGYEEDFSFEEVQEEIIIFDYEEIFVEPILQGVYVEDIEELIDLDIIEEPIAAFQEPVVVVNYTDFIAEEVIINPVEELIQLFEFETIIREELEQEQEIQVDPVEVVEVEEVEEIIEVAENDEEVIEELEEETEELLAEETSTSGGITSTMLSVVNSTIRTASASSNSSNNVNTTNNNTSSSTSGISTSNSPSMSDQITSANAQNNMVLSLNTNDGGGQTQSVTTIITPLATLDSSPQVVMAEVQVQNMQGEISTAVSGAMTQSEADQIADQIIANNIKEQQEELQEEAQETGQYADQSTLVAYLGYVPAFEVYKGYEMPKQNEWYTPKDIYTDAVINDNTQAFYGLSTESYNTLNEMIQSQPNL